MGRFLSILIPATLLAWPGHSQSTATPPAFEVADIKPSANPMPGKGRLLPGGRIEIPGMNLKEFIMFAYGVQDNMIVGTAKWAETDRFDIVAKAASDTPMPTLRLMFQNLLAERFKLAIHRENKVMPAYVLTVGKRASKLREGSGGRQECGWQSLEGGLRRRECRNLTMAEFAKQLPGLGGAGIDLPVVDETGLKGAYDFQFDMGFGGMGRGDGPRPGDGPAAAIPDSGPTIFAALEQIGLKLESRKMPMPVIVVDHAELPAVN
jgi:uncharacterized protein (TIGR03435 family)